MQYGMNRREKRKALINGINAKIIKLNNDYNLDLEFVSANWSTENLKSLAMRAGRTMTLSFSKALEGLPLLLT